MNTSNLTPEEISALKELVKFTYKDAMQPASKQIGKLGADLMKSIRLLTSPIQYLAHQQDRLDAHFEKILKDIPDENIISPPDYLLLPTIEKLQFLNVNDYLANAYQKLLSNACDKDKIENVHPAFINIINQLSEDEIKIIDLIGEIYPNTIRVAKYIDSNDFYHVVNTKKIHAQIVTRTITELEDKEGIAEERFTIEQLRKEEKLFLDFEILHQPKYANMYIGHLENLNLIEKASQKSSNLEMNNVFLSIGKEQNGKDVLINSNVDFFHYRLTDLGNLFYKVCTKKSIK